MTVHNHPLVIDKGIPIPDKTYLGRPRLGVAQTVGKMVVGDSIFFETDKPNAPFNAVRYRFVKKGWEFASRKVDGGFRLWRIK